MCSFVLQKKLLICSRFILVSIINILNYLTDLILGLCWYNDNTFMKIELQNRFNANWNVI